MLTAAETQAVAMVIHELVTNAAKYGALSSPDGRVSVSWDRTGADVAATLTITWRELGGPPITASVQSVMAAASSAISFPMSLAVPSTWYFHRTARTAKLKFPFERR